MGGTNEKATTIAFQASNAEKAELKKLGNVSELVRRSYLERLHETHPEAAKRIEEFRREYDTGIDINRKKGAAKRVGNIRRAHAANKIDSERVKDVSRVAEDASVEAIEEVSGESPMPSPQIPEPSKGASRAKGPKSSGKDSV